MALLIQPVQGPVWGSVRRVVPMPGGRHAGSAQGEGVGHWPSLAGFGRQHMTAFVSGELGVPATTFQPADTEPRTQPHAPGRPQPQPTALSAPRRIRSSGRTRSPEGLFDQLPLL